MYHDAEEAVADVVQFVDLFVVLPAANRGDVHVNVLGVGLGVENRGDVHVNVQDVGLPAANRGDVVQKPVLGSGVILLIIYVTQKVERMGVKDLRTKSCVNLAKILKRLPS